MVVIDPRAICVTLCDTRIESHMGFRKNGVELDWLFLLLGALALILLVVGGATMLSAQRTRAATGVPWGDIVFADLQEETLDAPLISRRHGLVGKPDLLLRQHKQGTELLIPVEVKSARQPRDNGSGGIHEGHLLQLGCYLLLVEENYEGEVTFGILRYADGESMVEWTPELREQVLDAADAIRAARSANNVARNHEDAGRCRNCGYSHACDEALI